MALTFANAITVAQMELNTIQRFGASYILLPESARHTAYGWLIPWANSDYWSKELTVGGNLPFFVNRFTGAICHAAGTQDFQEWLADYARKHGYDTVVSDTAPSSPSSSPGNLVKQDQEVFHYP